MDPEAFAVQVKAALDQARTTLGRIEIEVRENEETPALMECSRLYAQFVLHAREFLFGLEQRRPLPRRLADKIEPLIAPLDRHRDVVARHALEPSPSRLRELAALARDVGPRA